MAFGQPILVALTLSLGSSTIRLETWCHLGLDRVPDRAIVGVVLIFFAVSAALALTFASDALTNRRLPTMFRLLWAVALVFAGPLTIPIDSFVFLRNLFPELN
jgi:hypothetical protein